MSPFGEPERHDFEGEPKPARCVDCGDWTDARCFDCGVAVCLGCDDEHLETAHAGEVGL